jgi:Protein of unknown function (DUF3300)
MLRKLSVVQPGFFGTGFLASLLLAALAPLSGFGQSQPYPQQQYPQQRYPQQQYPYPQQQPYPQQTYPQQEPYPQQPVYGQAPPMLAPQQLDSLVERIALYPDSLLAQVLTASTYADVIPAAATWAVQHQYLRGDALARAIQEDQLPWPPSVIALLPFPGVLDEMARDMNWTQQLGNAVLAQRPDVMDAVQRMRQEAMSYGYLQSNQYVRVLPSPGYIEIVPVSPDLYYVPVYNPYVVFARPRPGFYVNGAIRFGSGITIGAVFAPWGWGGSGFGWREHTILIDRRPWDRGWVNRREYVHPYSPPPPRYEGRPVERHEIHGDADRGHGHEHEHEHDHGR